jgi:hypothetical protein
VSVIVEDFPALLKLFEARSTAIAARPPFSLDRIEVQRDGRIAFRLKQPRKGRTHRVMDPLSFMARLAAQIPHPKLPLIRYHGVFSSRSSWRPLVTPKPPPRASQPKPCAAPAAAAQQRG